MKPSSNIQNTTLNNVYKTNLYCETCVNVNKATSFTSCSTIISEIAIKRHAIKRALVSASTDVALFVNDRKINEKALFYHCPVQIGKPTASLFYPTLSCYYTIGRHVNFNLETMIFKRVFIANTTKYRPIWRTPHYFTGQNL